MRSYPSIAIAAAPILLPREGTDLARWAVVACDQYTSQPEYWEQVEALVGDQPSTLRLVFPEVHLGKGDAPARIGAIRGAMQRYLDDGVFVEHVSPIYLERTTEGRTRRGVMVSVDLEAYDYSAGSKSLIRATEGTIVDRLPPRIEVRAGAPIELPHIMVLIDDPEDTVIGPLARHAASGGARLAYTVDLMCDGGHLRGFDVAPDAEGGMVQALERLGDAEAYCARYGLPEGEPVLLYAMGDGNHSLATAKAIWERTKREASDQSAVMESPTRHALVELVNVHDPALEFEPIHRVLFDLTAGRDLLAELSAHFGDRLTSTAAASSASMVARVDAQEDGSVHRVGLVCSEGSFVVELAHPEANLPVGSIQPFLDAFMASNGAREIDYVHGTEPVLELGGAPGNVGLYLPSMSKHELFRTVILDGALPRKTFSLGEAHEKRYYMECRRIDGV